MLSEQIAYYQRKYACGGLPEHKIWIISPDLGGGFGN
jgi:hypothetical protein